MIFVIEYYLMRPEPSMKERLPSKEFPQNALLTPNLISTT
jgi:hypothetical protein